jgi:anti-anti-sigma regulatory factor
MIGSAPVPAAPVARTRTQGDGTVTRTFHLDHLPDVPVPGQVALLLTALVDLDLATSGRCRAELLEVAGGEGRAVVLDLRRVFVGAHVVRDLVALAERAGHAGRPVAVVGAPRWLVELAANLDMPPVRFVDDVAAAVAGLRAAAGELRR